jgi:hypothetical protein
MTDDQLYSILREIFEGQLWPRPFNLLQAAERVRAGEDPKLVAKAARTTVSRLVGFTTAPDSIQAVFGLSFAKLQQKDLDNARRTIGQLVLGRAAEIAFEDIYRSEMHAHELELRDLRESRTDTDYRLYNGQGRPIYRVNIKFHGAQFRRAPELVGLEPLDCFALATYKICGALQKQEEERLPYIFAIVGVPHLTGEVVGKMVSDNLVQLVALVHAGKSFGKKRDFEDRVVDYCMRSRVLAFRHTYDHIINGRWYILSARKADKLLRELLFQRVYALRIRGFARAFRAAELDMHFSLSQDLVELRQFLATLRSEGLTKVATLMERGEY